MKLPDNSIGVTDILQYRDCARRFAYGMERHSGAERPEATSPSNAYGSAFHDAVGFLRETGGTDEEAILFVTQGRFGRWLSPDDLERMHKDFETYRSRDYYGVETIAVEGEYRVPLMVWQGEQYYYRFRIDRLYRSSTDPSTWLHVDYKTSAHPKSEAEIHADMQFSAYALGIRDMFPEIETLIQMYDQLNFGVIPTQRTPEQIERTREWLIDNAIAILEDDVLTPTYNSFCAYCPVLMDCSVVPQLTDYALAEISGLMPELDDEGNVTLNGKLLEGAELEPYVEALEKVTAARKILDAYDGRIRGTLRELPVDQRLHMGFKTSTPKVSSWSPEALEQLAGMLGPEFFRLIKLPKTAVSRLPKEKQELINGLAVSHQGAPRMTRVRQPVESPFGDAPAPSGEDDDGT